MYLCIDPANFGATASRPRRTLLALKGPVLAARGTLRR